MFQERKVTKNGSYYNVDKKTGLYIVWCTVEYTKGKTENHAFVFDSNFSSWKGKIYYGAIIDDRKYSNF